MIASASSSQQRRATSGAQSPATISTGSLVLLLLCLVVQLCRAADTTATNNAAQQQQQQQAEEQKALIDQLLRLTEAQPTGEQATGVPLETLLAKATQAKNKTKKPIVSKSKSSMVQQDEALSEDDGRQEEKRALKRKWHKLVDELIDSSPKFEVNKPQARKRQLQAGNSPAPSDESQSQPVVKRKSLELEDLDGGASAAGHQGLVSNSLGDLLAQVSGSQGGPSSARRPISAADHQRRILDDKFGILRHSIFSTNNQLGTKEVPKYGSDEQL